jgi:hypothetical protein
VEGELAFRIQLKFGLGPVERLFDEVEVFQFHLSERERGVKSSGGHRNRGAEGWAPAQMRMAYARSSLRASTRERKRPIARETSAEQARGRVQFRGMPNLS